MSRRDMADATLEEALRLIEAKDTRGLDLVLAIASGGDPDGLFLLAEMTLSGTMVRQDAIKGRQLLEYAGSRGHGRANIMVTNLLANGVAGKRNWPIALQRLAAEARVIPERSRALELIETMELDAQGDPVTTPESKPFSDRPHAVLFERLLSPNECAYLIGVVGELFEPSMVYDEWHRRVRDTIRTSDGATVNWVMEDPAVQALNRRIAAATNTAYDQGEALHVLRYSPGQQYRPHFDWINGAENQRIWTALVYLNEDYEGGATAFVRTGQEVRGKTGDMLLFSNAQEDGHGDPLAEHAGRPVTSGTKYLATRWIREARWIP
jgi:prolyl 4-hydroxylase